MARTSLVISITFTGFIMLSIAHMASGVSRLDKVVTATGPYKTADIERSETIVTNLHDGAVNDQGTTGVNAAKGLATANLVGDVGVDLKNDQVKINGSGDSAVGKLAGVERSGHIVVDLKNGQVVDEGGENKVKAADVVVVVKRGGGKTAVDLKKEEVQNGGQTSGNRKNSVPENSYPANNDVPATENTNGSYN
ncbi:hypothetical protein C5167_026607 [Papaver somniferum]|uniref:uncharacterized protein LOC113326578 n=1 Tax=Papaver somniferum TaxID=3469 RepID=UPI000E6FDA69|nr:uncharacterized protein LOC113326578 [Papaver somniferum]RZC85937.1 hypothetical protein C5167_026607 [Papaver somniferum]